MKFFTKGIVIVGFIFLFLIIWAFVIMSRQSSGHITPGPLGVILIVGLVAAIRAIVKYKPKKDTGPEKATQKAKTTSLDLDKYQLKKD